MTAGGCSMQVGVQGDCLRILLSSDIFACTNLLPPHRMHLLRNGVTCLFDSRASSILKHLVFGNLQGDSKLCLTSLVHTGALS